MAKKAYLVISTFVTRVIADENLEDEKNWQELANKSEEAIIAKIQNDELSENIEDVIEDEECPYGSLDKDKC